MNKIFNYIVAGVVGCAMLAGCSDDALETAPTDSMSSSGISDNAGTAIVALMVCIVLCIIHGHLKQIHIKVSVSIRMY